MPERNWSTKTLARQLRIYLDQNPTLGPDSKLSELVAALKSDIVKDEVGMNMDYWPDPL